MNRALVLLASTPFLLGACGLLFTKGPPAGHEQMTSFEWTQSNTGPVVDIVFGAVNLIASIAVANDPSNEYYSSSGQAIASGVIWAAISGVSAGVGFDRVKKCVAAKRALRERQANAHPASVGSSTSVGLVPVQTVLIMGGRDTLTVGEQVQFVAKAFDSTNAVISGSAFAWSSSNDAIASVSNSGLVTTRAPGTVVIAANSANVVGTTRVVVLSPQ